MDAHKEFFHRFFFQQDNRRLIIPEYQRKYSWRSEDCNNLYEDLLKLIESKDKKGYEHFFGSIVSQNLGDAITDKARRGVIDYSIIDGQQRITTIFLLYAAIRNYLLKENPKNPLINTLEQYMQFDNTDERLLLKKSDREDFKKIINNEKIKVSDFKNYNLYTNYIIFCERLKKDYNKINDILKAIEKLCFVHIIIQPNDNPQVIFESLNAMGVPLSESDKIRNLIFMRVSPDGQADLYNNYWLPIENNTGGNEELSNFLETYINIKNKKKIKDSDVYLAFKKYIDDKDIKTILEDIKDYSVLYKELLKYECDSKVQDGIHGVVFRLNALKINSSTPLLLELMHLCENNMITSEELDEMSHIIESYIFRLKVCDAGSKNLKNTLLSLIRDIPDDVETWENNGKLERLKNRLVNSNFPDDDEFKEKFGTIEFYKKPIPILAQYALERLDQYGTREDNDLWKKFNLSKGDPHKLTIEHIMPQSLSQTWKNDLTKNSDADWQKIHRDWLHRIANLTITAYNSQLKNKSFQEKKRGTVDENGHSNRDGYADSGISLNRDIATDYDTWGLEALEKRNKKLIVAAVEIWERPDVSANFDDDNLDEYSLDFFEDDRNLDILTKRDIKSFSYQGEHIPVTSWSDMYVQIIKILHAENPIILIGLANTKKDKAFRVRRSKPKGKEKAHFRCIDENAPLFIGVNFSTIQRIKLLLRLFERYKAEAGDLIFYLKKDKPN